jgi:hypothetical protein
MTHTLHRRGDPASLERDFVVLTLENRAHVAPSRRDRLAARFPRLYGLAKRVFFGLGLDRFLNRAGLPGGDAGLDWTKVCHSRDELHDYLERIRRADTGRSVVVSGVFESVDGCLADMGLRPHTVHYSLGCFGKAGRLPREEILEITTLCGHHLVSPRLVEKLARDVGEGDLSRAEAAAAMGGLCLCKIFNERRAAELLAGPGR